MKLKIRSWPLLALLLALATGTPAQAQLAAAPYEVPRFRHVDPLAKPPDLNNLGTIRLLADEDFPPFSYRDSSGALTGFSIAMANALCDELKITCQFSARPYDALLPALAAGEADVLIAGLRLTPALLEKADATRPYYRSLGRFAVQQESPITLADETALADKRLGAVAGSVHEAYLKAHFEDASRSAYPDMQAAGKALQAGEVDAVFADAAGLIFWTLSPASGNCCRLAEGAYVDTDTLSPGMSFLFKRGDTQRGAILDHGLDRLESSGVQAVIFRRFFPVSPW
jgi:polar amino acid transport system substrate-binding protein